MSAVLSFLPFTSASAPGRSMSSDSTDVYPAPAAAMMAVSRRSPRCSFTSDSTWLHRWVSPHLAATTSGNARQHSAARMALRMKEFTSMNDDVLSIFPRISCLSEATVQSADCTSTSSMSFRESFQAFFHPHCRTSVTNVRPGRPAAAPAATAATCTGCTVETRAGSSAPGGGGGGGGGAAAATSAGAGAAAGAAAGVVGTEAGAEAGAKAGAKAGLKAGPEAGAEAEAGAEVGTGAAGGPIFPMRKPTGTLLQTASRNSSMHHT